MPAQICDKCYKPAEVLIPLRLGGGGATSKCCPACSERIKGREEMEVELKKAEH